MALPEPFTRGTFLVDLANSRQEAVLRRVLTERNVINTPFNRVWNILRNSGCEGGKNCRFVVLEAEYVDRDYAEGYGQLYGRAFRHFERLCYRLHFFADGIKQEDFDITSLSSEQGKEKRDKLCQCYMGFAVIRPSCPDTVGRTVILPPKSTGRNSFALCRCEYSLNLAGITLKATGVPFMEQDGMVGACASAAMWMAHMCVYKDRGLPTYSTTEITRLADVGFPSPSRVFPSEGLTVDQVGAGLKRMGHETFVRLLSSARPETVRHWIYIHVESCIPTILATEEEGVGHAVVVVGHRLGGANLRRPTYQLTTGDKIYSAHCWSSEILVHDDQRGPYLTSTIVSTRRQEPRASLRYRPSDLVEQAGRNPRLDILAAIVLLPPHVNCDGLRAERKAVRLLNWLILDGSINLGKEQRLVVRTFLLPSNEFKEKLDASRGMTKPLITKYRYLHLPKYLWMTEWTTLQLWGRPIEQKRILGEVLIDPTSNPNNLDFLAFHVPGKLYFMHPEERDATVGLSRPVDIPNDTSYSPLTRPAS